MRSYHVGRQDAYDEHMTKHAVFQSIYQLQVDYLQTFRRLSTGRLKSRRCAGLAELSESDERHTHGRTFLVRIEIKGILGWQELPATAVSPWKWCQLTANILHHMQLYHEKVC